MIQYRRASKGNGLFESILTNGFSPINVITIRFILPLKSETAAANGLLPGLLCRQRAEDENPAAFARKLEGLYGTHLSGKVEKIGNTQIVKISASFIDDRFALEQEKVAENVSALLNDLLFHPYLMENRCSEEDLEYEKEQIAGERMMNSSDPVKAAFSKSRQLLFQEDAFGIPAHGYEKQVEALTLRQVRQAYHAMMTHAQIVWSFYGSDEKKALSDCFFEKLAQIENMRESVSANEKTVFSNVEETVSDLVNEQQTRIVMTYEVGSQLGNGRILPAQLLSVFLGGGQNSRLFQKLREQNGFCYDCSSKINLYKGILTIECGTDRENADCVQKLIREEIAKIAAGQLSDREFENARAALRRGFQKTGESLAGLEGDLFRQSLVQTPLLPEQKLQLLDTLSKEDLTSAARSLKLHQVYLRIGVEHS